MRKNGIGLWLNQYCYKILTKVTTAEVDCIPVDIYLEKPTSPKDLAIIIKAEKDAFFIFDANADLIIGPTDQAYVRTLNVIDLVCSTDLKKFKLKKLKTSEYQAIIHKIIE